jgi:6-phosphogluconolactonase
MSLLSDITSLIEKTLTENNKASIALSGGSSPLALYEALSEKDIDWSKVTVTLIDDRLVPADHQDSNQRLIKQTFLQNKAAKVRFISLNDWSQDQIPDIGILGMGADGHFASLFPQMMNDDMAFDHMAKPAILTTPPMGSPKHPRITMNLAMILAIPDRVLMVIGDEKIAVLDAALTGTELPITRLLAHDGTRITKERI